MAVDWGSKFYTDVVVTHSMSCPSGTKEIYENTWDGSDHGCDCSNICGRYMSGCYKLMVGRSCNRN